MPSALPPWAPLPGCLPPWQRPSCHHAGACWAPEMGPAVGAAAVGAAAAGVAATSAVAQHRDAAAPALAGGSWAAQVAGRPGGHTGTLQHAEEGRNDSILCSISIHLNFHTALEPTAAPTKHHRCKRPWQQQHPPTGRRPSETFRASAAGPCTTGGLQLPARSADRSSGGGQYKGAPRCRCRCCRCWDASSSSSGCQAD